MSPIPRDEIKQSGTITPEPSPEQEEETVQPFVQILEVKVSCNNEVMWELEELEMLICIHAYQLWWHSFDPWITPQCLFSVFPIYYQLHSDMYPYFKHFHIDSHLYINFGINIMNLYLTTVRHTSVLNKCVASTSTSYPSTLLLYQRKFGLQLALKHIRPLNSINNNIHQE